MIDFLNGEGDDILESNGGFTNNKTTAKTEGIITGLSDEHFARMQFELIFDKESAREEFNIKEVQFVNIVELQLSQMTEYQLNNDETFLNELQEQMNLMLEEGEITDIKILVKVIE